MQSSDTPGYQKVQTQQPNQTINVNINNQNVQAPSITADDIIDANEVPIWKQILYIVGTTAGASLIGLGINKISGVIRKHLKTKAPKFRGNIDDDLRELGEFSLGCEDQRQKIKSTVSENAMKGKALTEQSQKGVNQTIKDYNEAENKAYDNFIDKYSLRQEDINKLNADTKTKQKLLKRLQLIKEKKYNNPLFESLDKKQQKEMMNEDIKFNPQFEERIKNEADKIDEKYKNNKKQKDLNKQIEMVSGVKEQEKSLSDILLSGDSDQLDKYQQKNNYSSNDILKTNKLLNEVLDEKEKEVQERQNLSSSLSEEQLNQQIKQLEEDIKYNEKIKQSGLKPQLVEWLDDLPDNYEKNKFGLKQYIKDSFESGEQPEPFNQKIFNYNVERNDPYLLTKIEQQNEQTKQSITPEKLDQFKATMLNQEKTYQQKLKELINMVPKEVQENEYVKPLFDLFHKSIDNIEAVNEKDLINVVSNQLDAVNKEARYYLDIIRSLVSKDDEVRKNLSKGMKAANYLINGGEYVLTKFTNLNEDDIETINRLLNLGDQVLGESENLVKYMKEELPEKMKNENFNLANELKDYFTQYRGRIDPLIEKLKRQFNFLKTRTPDLSRLIGNVVNILQKTMKKNKTIKKLKSNLPFILSVMQAVGHYGGEISEYLYDIENKIKENPYQVIFDGIDLGTQIFDGTIIKYIKEAFPKIKGAMESLSYFRQRLLDPYSPEVFIKYKNQYNKQKYDYYDIRRLLSNDLQEQERIIQDLTDKYNINWKNHVDMKNLNDIEVQRPTQTERQIINNLTNKQISIQSEPKYLLFDQLKDKPTVDEQLEELNWRKEANMNDIQEIENQRNEALKQNEEYYRPNIESNKELIQGVENKKNNYNRKALQAEQNYKTANELYEKYNKEAQYYSEQLNDINLKKEKKNKTEAITKLKQKRQEEINQVQDKINNINNNKNKISKQQRKIQLQSATNEKKQINEKYQNLIDQQENKYNDLVNKQKQLTEYYTDNVNKANDQDYLRQKYKKEFDEQNKLYNDELDLYENYKQAKEEDEIDKTADDQIINDRYNKKLKPYLIENQQIEENIKRLEPHKGEVYSNVDKKFYPMQEVLDYYNEKTIELKQLNNQLKKYEKQMNYINEEKFKDHLTAAQQKRIEQVLSFNRYNKKKKSQKRNLIQRINEPLYKQVYTTSAKQMPYTQSEIKERLRRLNYNPDKSYYYDKDIKEQITPKDNSIKISYNQKLYDELFNLKQKYNQKFNAAPSYEYTNLKNEYEKQYNNIINKHVNENKNLVVEQQAPNLKIKDLVDNNYNTQLQLDSLKNDELYEIMNKQMTPETIKEYNQKLREIKQGDPDFILNELQEKSPLWTWSQYLKQYEQQKQNRPTKINQYINDVNIQDIPEYQDKNYSFPSYDETFHIQETNEMPIKNYLRDNGLTNIKDFVKMKQSEDDSKLPVQIKIILDDIIPNYGEYEDVDEQTNIQAQKWRRFMTQDEDKIHVPNISKQFTTMAQQKILNNLEFIEKEVSKQLNNQLKNALK